MRDTNEGEREGGATTDLLNEGNWRERASEYEGGKREGDRAATREGGRPTTTSESGKRGIDQARTCSAASCESESEEESQHGRGERTKEREGERATHDERAALVGRDCVTRRKRVSTCSCWKGEGERERAEATHAS